MPAVAADLDPTRVAIDPYPVVRVSLCGVHWWAVRISHYMHLAYFEIVSTFALLLESSKKMLSLFLVAVVELHPPTNGEERNKGV